jgi:hypothetical protein
LLIIAKFDSILFFILYFSKTSHFFHLFISPKWRPYNVFMFLCYNTAQIASLLFTQVCDYTLPEQHMLPSQLSKHHMDLGCEACQQSFSSPALLAAHRRLHRAEMQHMCSLCEKKFSTAKNLKRHVRYGVDVLQALYVQWCCLVITS